MIAWYLVTAFIVGILIGSFLNVVILRRGTGLSISKGRSKCFSCEKTLEWYELIPVYSYIFLRGKCLVCKSSISIQYPIVEFLSGISFATLFYLYLVGNISLILLALYIAIFCILIVIAVYDLRHKIIPDEWSLIFGILTFLVALNRFFTYQYFSSLAQYLDILSGVILFIPFYFLWKFSDGKWMGLGDGKLAVGIGFLLGFAEGLSAIALSFWIGAVVAGGMLFITKVVKHGVLKGSSNSLTMKSEVPFAPFLILGTIIVFFWQIDLFSLHAFGF